MQLGLPNLCARYEILRSGLLELVRVGLVGPAVHLPLAVDDASALEHTAAYQLLQLAAMCDGFSGRALRKLPLQAHALAMVMGQRTVGEYLGALGKAIEAAHEATAGLGADHLAGAGAAAAAAGGQQA
jgi:hypothetical protein